MIAVLVDNRWGSVLLVRCGREYVKRIFAKDKRNRKFEILGVLTDADCELLFFEVPIKLSEQTLTVAQTRALLQAL